jgi:hypothetical protein
MQSFLLCGLLQAASHLLFRAQQKNPYMVAVRA